MKLAAVRKQLFIVVAYCSNLCGDLFELFDKRYRGNAVGMFHGRTPPDL